MIALILAVSFGVTVIEAGLNDIKDDLTSKMREKYRNAYLQTPELIEEYGYPSETHKVTTEDGYILTVHRIPADKKSSGYKGPIIVQHGLIASSAAWAISGPNSFAFLLSKSGYDVWLPNLRGNYYSRDHVNLSRYDSQFWEFSWHQSGMYDLPAIIDYVLKETDSKKVIYVGHSMGTTVSYVLLSMRPEYNEKLRALVSLSPVADISNATSLAAATAVTFAVLRDVLKDIGVNEVLMREVPDTNTKVITCEAGEQLCNFITFYISGTPPERINQSNVPNIAGQYPAGTSRDMIAHYGQTIRAGRFVQFDYGPAKNTELYGSENPPEYILKKITAPTLLYYGLSDTLGDPTDVRVIASKLPNVVENHAIQNYGHVDMNYAKDADKYVYIPLIKELEKY